jgi:ribosomal protein S18 acetylase RimI-like enzyme
MGIVIWPAVEEDAPELMQLDARLFDNAMTEGMLQRELQVGEGFVVRQFHDQGAPILGYILVRNHGGLLDILRLGVAPTAQRLGIGTALLKRALEKGCTTVLTVKKDNVHAIRLYKRHGFNVVGHFVQERAWVLRRDAEPSDRPAA